MIFRLCGRFDIDPEWMWIVTPAEFSDLLEGRLEQDRAERFNFARIESTIRGAVGSYVDPFTLIGEPQGIPDLDETEDERKAFVAEHRKAIRDRAHREWMPGGVVEASDLVQSDPHRE